MSELPKKGALERMLESGTSLTGVAVGLGLAGPVGAVGGWAVVEVMKVGTEFALRRLAPRAGIRVGATVLLVRDEVSARLMAGQIPRQDLQAEITPGRSCAEELAEATLKAAADTHEERKVRYLAHLLAAIVFEPELSHAHANQLVTVAEQLTYRQLVALAVYTEFTGDHWGEHDDLQAEGRDWVRDASELVSLRSDLLDLFRRGLVRVSPREHRVRREKPYKPPTSRRGLGSQTGLPQYEHVKEALPWPAMPMEISPRDTRLSEEGERLARMMRLADIPNHEREDMVLAHLRVPDREEQ